MFFHTSKNDEVQSKKGQNNILFWNLYTLKCKEKHPHAREVHAPLASGRQGGSSHTPYRSVRPWPPGGRGLQPRASGRHAGSGRTSERRVRPPRWAGGSPAACQSGAQPRPQVVRWGSSHTPERRVRPQAPVGRGNSSGAPGSVRDPCPRWAGEAPATRQCGEPEWRV